MENQVFERDYSQIREMKRAAASPVDKDIFEYAKSSGFFKAFSEAMDAMPKYIVPEDAAAYEELLPRLDALAQRWGGTIKGVVDYEKWESYIIVTLPFFECTNAEEFSLLTDIASKADMMNISATEDGQIRLYVMIDYFSEIGDKENLIEETIRKDEGLVSLLLHKREEEKNYALNHPILSKFLKNQGERLGMTAEELYDAVDYVCQNDPESIMRLFDEGAQTADDE